MDSYAHAGFTFDVLDSGPADGPAVVLLHGFPQDARSWDRVVPLLNGRGLRTLAPDLRGYSPGARPRERRAYTIDKLAGDVIGLLDAAGLARAQVVGHDWGGGVAWATAIRHPGRVSGLTAVSTPHPAAMQWAFRHSLQGLRSWYMLAFQLPWLPERIAAATLRSQLPRTGLSQAAADHYAERFADPESLRGPLNYYRAMFLTSPAQAWGQVAVPTTYVWGRRDPFLGRAAADRTAAYVTADYRFVEVEGGHWLPEENPGVVAEAVLATTTN